MLLLLIGRHQRTCATILILYAVTVQQKRKCTCMTFWANALLSAAEGSLTCEVRQLGQHEDTASLAL